MNKIINVTFPRSGHHWLVNELASLSGRDYNESGSTISGKIVEPPFIYCPCYQHCSMTPCVDEDTTWCKTHDFELLRADKENEYHLPEQRRHISPLGEYLYVVQIRKMEDALASLFLFYQDNGHYLGLDYNKFYADHEAYYERFCRKWLVENPNRMIVRYEDMVSNIDGVIKDVREWAAL